MNRLSRLLLTLALCAPLASTATAQEHESIIGTWRAPNNTLQVRTAHCGELLCGTVTYASAKAIGDAKAGGYNNLVGTDLFQNYHATGPGTWTGQVLIPKQNRTYLSRIVQQGPNKILISGCILGGLFCKSQVWTRE